MASLAGTNLGRYQLQEVIGQGGMATVYKAFDPQRDGFVAVKVLSSVLAEESNFVERFRREAKVLMKLNHPQIVPVLDFGESGEHAYLVMPYFAHGNLTQRLRNGALSPHDSARVLDQLASALSYAHEQGVVHRDMKPSNVLLDDDGNAFLTDFGLAKIHNASLSLTGSDLLGTPTYISPEQARGATVDARSDQYSLGIMLYELATGQVPFDGDTPMVVAIKHISEPLPPPRSLNPHVPSVIERVILKATAKNPDDRFPSVHAMNSAFQEALAYVLNPKAHRRPTIDLKETPRTPQSAAGEPNHLGGVRSRLLLFTAVALMVLLPLGATWLMDLIGQSGNGNGLPSVDSHDQELTAQAGTIAALFTQIAGGEDGLTFEQMQTAVAQTMAAYDGTIYPSESPTDTPPSESEQTATALAGASGTPSSTASPTSTDDPTTSPTATPTPTPSGTPTKTRTPIPTTSSTPTKTPDPSTTSVSLNPCDTFTLRPVVGDLYTVKWKLINDGPTVLITRISLLSWPIEHLAMIKVWLGGNLIWDGYDTSPPSTILPTPDPWVISSGAHVYIIFRFDKPTTSNDYVLELELNGTCTISDDRN
jgi:serine/threonine protein kinase